MNPFKNRTPSLNGPAQDIVPVVPSDTSDFDTVAVALYIETGGTLAFTTVAGSDRNVSVPDATLLPVGARAVKATGTSAQGIHALTLS